MQVDLLAGDEKERQHATKIAASCLQISVVYMAPQIVFRVPEGLIWGEDGRQAPEMAGRDNGYQLICMSPVLRGLSSTPPRSIGVITHLFNIISSLAARYTVLGSFT